MEFILFLIFLILHLAIFASLSYLSRLLFFEKKDEYYREEITSLGRAAPIEILRVLESGGNAILGLAFFFLSALFVFLWAMLGGAIGSPHYTHSIGNYFFHFPLFFFAFIFSYSFLKSAAQDDNPQDPLSILSNYGQAIATGLSIGSLSKILTSYGSYHEMYFFFYFVLLVLISFISAYLWNGRSLFGLEMPGSTGSNWEADSWQQDAESYEEQENFADNTNSSDSADDTYESNSFTLESSNNDSSDDQNDLDYGSDDLTSGDSYEPESDLDNSNSDSINGNSLDSSDFDLEWDDFVEKQD
jgi:hypothetical protein